MVISLFAAIGAGILWGYLCLDVTDKDILDKVLVWALNFMMVVGGIEIGGNKDLMKKILTPQNMVLATAIPLLITVGTFAGAWLSSFFTGLSLYDSILIAAGLGWYSLSSVVISTMYSTEMGTISFLSNMLREASSFILIPLLARFNKILCLAPGAAGTMDSLLPITIKYTGMHISMYAFISGVILSLIIPLLLSFLLEYRG